MRTGGRKKELGQWSGEKNLRTMCVCNSSVCMTMEKIIKYAIKEKTEGTEGLIGGRTVGDLAVCVVLLEKKNRQDKMRQAGIVVVCLCDYS